MHARAGERTPEGPQQGGRVIVQLAVGKAHPSQGKDGVSVNADGFLEILSADFGIRLCWVSISASPPSSWLTLGKSLPLSEPHFLYQMISTLLQRVLGGNVDKALGTVSRKWARGPVHCI